MEDLHWVDPTTLELLSLLVDQGPTARILALWTFRPDFRPPWTGRSHLTQVTLPRLPRQQAKELSGRVAHGRALPPEVVEQVVAKTDGVPLFVEELTKMVLESGLLQERAERYELTGPLPPLAIPTTLHDSLMDRLDRLAAVKALAQLGATLGREFSYELLQAVAPWDEEILRQGLQQLVAAEFLYHRGVPPQATYLFKHALIQDIAYQPLLRSTRQHYHHHIAQVLEQRFPSIAATQPELLAHHYTEAGLHAQAIPYWQKAGLRASEHSAYMEALAHLTAGLSLLPLLPATPARTQQELVLQLALGPVLGAIKGNADPEVGQVYTRARVLCQEIGDTPHHFPVLVGLWRFTLIQGKFLQAHELGIQLHELAERARDVALRLEAQRALGMTLFFLGDLMAARLHLEQGMRLYHPGQHRGHATLYGRDPGVDCHAYAALTLGFLGHTDQALAYMHTALTLAEQLAYPLSQGWVLVFTAWLHQFHGAERLTQEWSEAAIMLAHEHNFPQVSAMGSILHGWACAMQGEGASGVAEMHQGLAAWRATGTEIARPSYLALLAEWYGKAGQGATGLDVLTEARAAAQHRQERFYEAEFYRLEGELLLAQSGDRLAEAASCFQHALTIARHQQARWWELRAAMSLARLWQQQGKRQDAYDLLAPIYGWFTEGFDTADMQEARAMLEELS
jgi:predicted ATPase